MVAVSVLRFYAFGYRNPRKVMVYRIWVKEASGGGGMKVSRLTEKLAYLERWLHS